MRTVALRVAATLVLSAGAPASAAHTGRPHLGRPVEVAALDAPLRLAGAGHAWRVAYQSTSWRGWPTVVTGTVTVPSGRPPVGGWPVASFGHGFAGTADACAASRTGPAPWERVVQEALLAAGYAVVVADYEGIGTPAERPIVDGRAEAYGMIDIVRAARWLAPVSRSWAAVGYSLGGHAALFAAWLAPSYAPELRQTGTIAMAPITQWAVQLAAPFVSDPAAPANPTLPYSGRSLALTSGGTFRAADYFTGTGLALVDLAGSVCIDQMAAQMAGLTNADVFLDPAAAAGAFLTLMAD
jgi:Secretory lipase